TNVGLDWFRKVQSSHGVILYSSTRRRQEPKNYAHTPLTTELARQSWSMTNSFVAFIPSNIYKTGNYNAISIVHRIVWNRIINYAQPLQQRMGKNNYLAKVIVKLRSATSVADSLPMLLFTIILQYYLSSSRNMKLRAMKERCLC
ncbi:hypothetical protein Lfee_2419, partial [Legionella feeleii]